MIRARNEAGFTLIELMMVIAVVGILAIPGMEYYKTAAKLTGVQTNYRSVTVAICGLQETDEIATKLTTLFGNSVTPVVEDMRNPITNKTGVATAVILANQPTAAVYVLAVSETTVPSANELPGYIGAVVAIVDANKSVVVYGCDEVGKVMPGLQMTIKF